MAKEISIKFGDRSKAIYEALTAVIKAYRTPVASAKTDAKKEDSVTKNDKYANMAQKILEIIGKDNLTMIDNCATRLRLTVKNNTNIDDEAIKKTGAFGVKRLGQEGYQIIVGTDVEFVADAMREIV